MKIFVINLARNPERMQRMQTLLGAQGLEFERLDAVDGKTLGDAEIARWSERRDDGSFCLSASEVGCMLSHRKAWQHIAEMEDGHAVILEDDLHFSPHTASFLGSNDWIPTDAEIIKIETVFWKTSISKSRLAIKEGHALARLRGQHFGMAGYVLTPESARRLLREIGKVNMAIDQILFDPASDLFSSLAIYQMLPALCVQDQFLTSHDDMLASDITRAWRINRKPKTFLQKVSREWNRLRTQTWIGISGSRFNPFSDRVNIRVSFPETGEGER